MAKSVRLKVPDGVAFSPELWAERIHKIAKSIVKGGGIATSSVGGHRMFKLPDGALVTAKMEDALDKIEGLLAEKYPFNQATARASMA